MHRPNPTYPPASAASLLKGSLSSWKMRADRFKESVCTVMLSGWSANTPCIVSWKLSMVSSGRPTIKSILMSSYPQARANENASSVCAAVCRRPDCLQHMVVQRLRVDADPRHPARKYGFQLLCCDGVGTPRLHGKLAAGAHVKRRRNRVQQLGQLLRRKRSGRSTRRCTTDSRRRPSPFATSAVCWISTQSSSKYSGMSFAVRSTEDDTKEQYEQRVGQNGMETYRLNDSGRERDKIFCSFPMVMRPQLRFFRAHQPVLLEALQGRFLPHAPLRGCATA